MLTLSDTAVSADLHRALYVSKACDKKDSKLKQNEKIFQGFQGQKKSCFLHIVNIFTHLITH